MEVRDGFVLGNIGVILQTNHNKEEYKQQHTHVLWSYTLLLRCYNTPFLGSIKCYA